MARKPVTLKTLKRLFALSGNRCAFPSCAKQLVDSLGNLQCQVCHIEAANPKGERYNAAQTDAQRRAFGNLVLLCHDHHVVTNDINAYPVPVMRKMKADHEARSAKLAFVVPEKALKAAQAQTINFGDGDGIQVLVQGSPGAVVHVNQHAQKHKTEEAGEVSILDEIFRGVLAKVSDGATLPAGPSIGLNEKIELNFKDDKEQEEVADYVRAALLKMTLVEGTFKALGSESQKDIGAHVLQKYNELKRQKRKNIDILTELFKEFTPAGHEKNPPYTNLARAFVLFFFDDCTIFEKTLAEKTRGAQ